MAIKTNLYDMVVGDKISCRYVASSGNVGTFSEFGSCTASGIPVTGTATPDGLFYFVHTGFDSNGRMKLVADRVIQHSISWDTMNLTGITTKEGMTVDLGLVYGTSIISSIRLLSGGTSSTDTDNEWNNIIVSSTLNGTITAGDNNVWNWNGLYSWTSTTNTFASNSKAIRGNDSAGGYLSYSWTSNTVSVGTGFRPVLIINILNYCPTSSLNITVSQNPKTTLFNLTGVISDIDSGTTSYTIKNNTTNTTLTQGSGVSVPYNLSFDIDVSQFPLGINIIEVKAFDSLGAYSIRTFKIYVFSDCYLAYSKSVMTKNILISKNIDNIMISAQNSGTMAVLYSLDAGATWAVGSIDSSVNVTQSNQVKLKFLMDSGASLKAYGIGWV